MQDPITFSAQCPTCKNEISQGPRDPDEMRRLIREDSLSFYCELCDLEWEPSHQELTNVECLLASNLELADPQIAGSEIAHAFRKREHARPTARASTHA